jgi:hypothetical protein
MKDIFAETTFGKLALAKIKPTEPNFRLYSAGWLGKHPNYDVMEVKGAVFRAAARGPRKGKLCIPIPGTERVAYVTKEEIEVIYMTNLENNAAFAEMRIVVTPELLAEVAGIIESLDVSPSSARLTANWIFEAMKRKELVVTN